MHKLQCNTNQIGKQYIWLDKTDSTNEVIKRLLLDGQTIEGEAGKVSKMIVGSIHHGLTVLADHQTKGKGRIGREWIDEVGTNIAMSVLLQPGLGAESISMVTLVSALAVAKTIKEKTGLEPQIKWPNDVLIGGRKVCGILTELEIGAGHYCVIVGIGINVNQTYMPEEIADIATSLINESEELLPLDREAIAASVLENLEAYYDKFCLTGNMSELMYEYNALLINRNLNVRVMDPSESIEGIARGIDDMGRLLVETPDGEWHHIFAGEVSVRGVYGYV
ncbi:MAG: biotin--[acetyl-CoA-carboxylase] ligase [Lachnospiraceae bacterium]|nr:biotin--[acetyl-CoA-carboxylase] ligase [Lachnospiraceae bacterium]